jgi:plasmid segregation protein ParM
MEQNYKEKKTEVIAVDHGFHMMKTRNFICENGVERCDTKPAFDTNTLCYKGKYYKIGESRMKVKKNKTMDEDYYLATLPAVAKEIQIRNLPQKLEIVLVVGLPFTRYGAEQKAFREYFIRDGLPVAFEYEGKAYKVAFCKVFCYPQCYAAIANRLGSMNGEYVVCDIGSWTIDIISLVDGVPQEKKCQTFDKAMINMMQEISKECIACEGESLSEKKIAEYIKNPQTTVIPTSYEKIVCREFMKFAKNVEGILKENGHSLALSNIIYVGGGASIMREYGHRGNNISYLDDVTANAKGYEYLAERMG